MMALPADLLNQVLDTAPVARLALLDGDDQPYALPIVFARVNTSLWSPVDGKPKRHGQLARLARIQRSPQVTVLVDNYGDDWRQLWWVRLAGQAAVVDAGEPYWDEAVAQLQRKYPQYRAVKMFHGDPVMIRFEWLRQKWWAPDGQAGIERWLSDHPR